MLRLTLSSSYYLAILISIIHSLAFVSIGIIDVIVSIKILIGLLIALSWVYYGRKAFHLTPKAIAAITIKEGGEIELRLRDGTEIHGMLADGSYIHPYFSTLRFRKDGQRLDRVIAVLPDMLSREQFRALRVWLKWKKLDDHTHSNF